MNYASLSDDELIRIASTSYDDPLVLLLCRRLADRIDRHLVPGRVSDPAQLELLPAQEKP